MQIDVTEQIETAKRLTNEWAERAGYLAPDDTDADALSQKARDLQRVMNVSSFGCQQRHVHKILEILIGEQFPIDDRPRLVDYQRVEPFQIGSILVPMREGSSRPGLVTRVSQSRNAGLRLSNGNGHQQHWSQHDLRPATDDEIETYYLEWFGIETNPADVGPTDDDMPNTLDDDELEHPF